mgnify:CR=1 FL=1|tara:strand:+ start:4931 stop:5233 length:303 start_codon:yes stop_codon:yes gene_type:complete
MANIFWAGPKASKTEVRKSLMEDGVEHTDNRFIVSFEVDDGGPHVVFRVERRDSGSPTWKKEFPIKYKGWRLLTISHPEGYLELFFNQDGTKRVTRGDQA